MFKYFRDGNLIAVTVLAAVFFLGTASFNYFTQSPDYVKWSSPDESANYVFSRLYATSGQLAFFDSASAFGDHILMPRSARNDFGWIKPVSFLGIILVYGGLASFFGTALIPFLTPLFAALGIIIFYFLIRRLFSERVALWSSFLLASFPVYIYYTVRSMFHNVLFVVLLLVALYLFTLALRSRDALVTKNFFQLSPTPNFWLECLAAGGAGLFLGLALITRTSEILWLAPAGLLTLIFYGRRLGITKSVILGALTFLPLLLVAYYNQLLYNSFWYGGYNEMNRSLDDIAQSGRELLAAGGLSEYWRYARLYFERLFANIFYFGFNFRQSLVMFNHYVIKMFPALFWSGLVGLTILLIQNIFAPRRKYFIYVLAWLGASVFLIFYYGSWQFNDNPDLTRFTIGNSYTRYWLPLYLGLMPLASLALVRLSRFVFWAGNEASRRWQGWAAFGLQAKAISLLLVWSLFFVLYGSEEGLSHLYHISRAEKVNTERVFSLTEPEAVIITKYHDKFFWPERRVIMGTFPNEEIFTVSSKLARYYPLYYYNFYFPAEDLNYLNERRLVPYGLRLELVQKLNANFGLYRLLLRENNGAILESALEVSNQDADSELILEPEREEELTELEAGT